MGSLQSTIIYGVSVYSEFGEIEYDIANDISEIGENIGLNAVWEGRDGNLPASVTIGITIGNYGDQDTNRINLDELQSKLKIAKEKIPVQQVIDKVKEYLDNEDIDDILVAEVDLIIVHCDS